MENDIDKTNIDEDDDKIIHIDFAEKNKQRKIAQYYAEHASPENVKFLEDIISKNSKAARKIGLVAGEIKYKAKTYKKSGSKFAAISGAVYTLAAAGIGMGIFSIVHSDLLSGIGCLIGGVAAFAIATVVATISGGQFKLAKKGEIACKNLHNQRKEMEAQIASTKQELEMCKFYAGLE